MYVDEKSANVVKQIFELYAKGKRLSEIIKIFSNEKVLVPAAYALKYYPENARHKEIENPYLWNANTLRRILNTREYLGHTILGKNVTVNFKTKTTRLAKEDELLIFENTNEPIIDKDLWNKVQKRKEKYVVRKKKTASHHRLQGYLYCKECGKRLAFNHCKREGRQFDSDRNFRCQRTHRGLAQKNKSYIKASVIDGIVDNSTKRISRYVLDNEEQFARELAEKWQLNSKDEQLKYQSEIKELKSRSNDIDSLISTVFENHIKGNITEKQSNKLLQQYGEEQRSIEQKILKLEEQLKKDKDEVCIDEFIKLVKKYNHVEEVTDNMLFELIDRVEIGVVKDVENTKVQDIEIYFNFIGDCVIPYTEKEIKEMKKREEREKIEREELRKQRKIDNRIRQSERRKQLRKLGKIDENFRGEYEKLLEIGRKANKKQTEKRRKERESNPEYLIERARKEHREKLNKMKIRELEIVAKTDEVAKEILETRRAKNKEKNDTYRMKRKINFKES